MSNLSKNVRFKNEFRLKLFGSYSDLLLNSEPLRELDVIKDLLRTCQERNIDPADMRTIGVNLAEHAGVAELISRDVASGRIDAALSKTLNKIIPMLLSKTEDPFLTSLANIQKECLPAFQAQKKGKKVTFSTKIYSWSLKPFVSFNLVFPGKSEQLFKLQFKIDVRASLQNLGIDTDKKTPRGILILEIAMLLSKIETPVGSQPINLQFESSKLELDFPFA